MVISRKSDRIFDIIIYAILSIILLIVIYPLYFVIIASISDPLAVIAGNVIWAPVRPSLESYKLVFRYSLVMSGYRNTLMYTTVGTALNIVMTIAAAYPISRTHLKGKNAVVGLMMFTMFFSGGMIPTYILINKMKLLDTF